MDRDKLKAISLIIGWYTLKITIFILIFTLASILFMDHFVSNITYCNNNITYTIK